MYAGGREVTLVDKTICVWRGTIIGKVLIYLTQFLAY